MRITQKFMEKTEQNIFFVMDLATGEPIEKRENVGKMWKRLIYIMTCAYWENGRTIKKTKRGKTGQRHAQSG